MLLEKHVRTAESNQLVYNVDCCRGHRFVCARYRAAGRSVGRVLLLYEERVGYLAESS